MISEEQLQLITGAVDETLTEHDAARLRRLLDASVEAREVFAKLKRDSDRLRKLPIVDPPANFHARVMAKIASLTTLSTPGPTRRTRPDRRRPEDQPRESQPWIPVAIAASVLIGIAGCSYWIFTRDNSSLARNSSHPPPATRKGAADPAWANWLPVDGARPPSAPMPQERSTNNLVRNDSQTPIVPTVESSDVAIAPIPRIVHGPLHASPFMPVILPFDFVKVRVPFLQALVDFDRDNVRQQLIEELGRDPAFRIDLFARDSARGVQILQNAANAVGLKVHADSTTMNYLKKGQVSSVVFYTDAMTAVELTALLAKLNTEDAKISPRVFDSVHATPVSRVDEIELRSVLGADPGLFKRAIPSPERGTKEIDKGKSISAGTADQIVKSITTGQGKTVEGSAVLLTWSPMQARTPPTTSAELKTFLSKRGERKPNAVPVIIVIRHGNG
jgi:hypothetical protein